MFIIFVCFPKFIYTKYADIKIDVLYKRVPLPGHYTLIDIAYIYSWKRNAPMKFFFRISDLSQAKDNCEYFIPLRELPIALLCSSENNRKSPLLKREKKPVNKLRVKTPELINKDQIRDFKVVKDEEPIKKILNATSRQIKEVVLSPPRVAPNADISKEVVVSKIKEPIEEMKVKSVKVGNSPVENHLEVTTPSPKSCVKAEQSLQIKVASPEKMPATVEERLKLPVSTEVISQPPVDVETPQQKPLKLIINVPKHLTTPASPLAAILTTNSSSSNPKSPKSKPPPSPSVINNIDEEKQNFLKSFELTALNSLPPTTNSKASSPSKNFANEMKQYKLATEIKQIKPLPAAVPSIASSTTPLQKLALKRKQTSHLKLERQRKRTKTNTLLKSAKVGGEYPKIAPKIPSSSSSSPNMESVKEIIQSLRKSQDAASPPSSTTTSSALQSLFGNCNINIPSSLSITLKEATADTVMTPIKPVINHIEILKLPDSSLPAPKVPPERATSGGPSSASEALDRLDAAGSAVADNTAVACTAIIKAGIHPNLPAKVAMPANTREIKTAPMNGSSSFQKMFEEAIKKPEFTQKIHAYPVKQLKDESPGAVVSVDGRPLSPTTRNSMVNAAVKRNLMEIASQLSHHQAKKSRGETDTVPAVVPPVVSPPSPISSTARPVVVNANGKVAIPRLPHSKSSPSSAPAVAPAQHQTVASLHSASLGMNYTVSINQQNCNGTAANAKVNAAVESPKSSPKHVSSSSPSLTAVVPKAKSPSLGKNGVASKPSATSYLDLTTSTDKEEATQKPLEITINGNAPLPPKLSSPRITTSTSPNLQTATTKGIDTDGTVQIGSTTCTNGPLTPLNLKSTNSGDDVLVKVPKTSPAAGSPDTTKTNGATNERAKITAIASPPPSSSKSSISTNNKKSTKTKQSQQKRHAIAPNSPTSNQQPQQAAAHLNPNELLEKYNIQNLAQLTAGWNLGTQLMSMTPPPLTANHQLAFQQAMLLKHFEIQNRQNWLNSTTSPLMVEYKKYLQQTLNAAAQVQQNVVVPAAAQTQTAQK